MLRLRRTTLALSPADVAFVALWCALTVVVLVPVWHVRMLPMLDTPDHLALARAWHSYRDPSYRISEYYALRVRGVPYLAFYALIHFLLYVFPIEVANKLVLSLYLILFPLSILALARALGRSRWLALGAFALAFNPGWIYGFSSYLLGTCCFYFGLAAVVAVLDGGERRHALVLAVVAVVAYLCHVMAWTLFGVTALVLVWIERRQLRRAAVACAAMLPSLLVAVYAFAQEKREHAYMTQGDGFVAVWRDVPTSVLEFPRRVLELFPGPLDMWALGILAATVVVLAFVHRDRTPSAHRLWCMVVVLALAYVTLPYSIKQPMSWWYVAPRVPALMAPLLLLVPSVQLSRWRLVAVAPLVAAAVLVVARLTVLYRDFNRRNLGFMRLVDQLPRGKPTLVLARGLIAGDPESSGDPASSAPVYWHFMSWPMALKGGFSPYLFDQGIPVRPLAATPRYNVMRTDALDFASAPQFDYYLVHSSSDVLALDRVRVAASDGAWTLYRRVAPANGEP